jgi:hypothetical protein
MVQSLDSFLVYIVDQYNIWNNYKSVGTAKQWGNYWCTYIERFDEIIGKYTSQAPEWIAKAR